MSLLEFRNSLLQSILDLLWAQWCVLGVPGRSKDLRGDCIDPEALILSTCHFGRYDQRIFDGMLGWLIHHENLININRLSSLTKSESSTDLRIFHLVASYLHSCERKPKWKNIAGKSPDFSEVEPFFLRPDGSSIKNFGTANSFFASYGFFRGDVDYKKNTFSFLLSHPASFWLRLRAFMGVSTRTDVFVYLSTHQEGENPSTIARVLGYAQAGIHQALVSMCDSGWVSRSEQRREVIYILDENIKRAFLSSLASRPHWLTWALFYRAAAAVWAALNETGLSDFSTDVQSAELRGAMDSVSRELSLIGFSGRFLEANGKHGGEYIDSLSMAWESIFKEIFNKDA